MEEKQDKIVFDTNSAFTEQVDKVLAGADSESSHLEILKTTPPLLRMVGVPNLPILMTAKHLKSITQSYGSESVNYHGLNVDVVKQLPELLSDPVMIMDSLTRDDSIVVVTQTVDKENRPIIGAIKLGGKGYINSIEIDANILSSAYGRESFQSFIERNIAQGKVLYVDKEKSQELAKIPGIQFPDNFATLDFDTIIRKTRAFVNIYTKNNSKTTKKEEDMKSDTSNTAQSARERVQQVRDEMVKTLLEHIEKNPHDWQAGWNNIASGAPYNGKTNTAYRGINALYLAFLGMSRNYKDARWVTFNQAKELGASVKKGEKSAPVIFFEYYDRATKKTFDSRTVKDMTEEEKQAYIKENVYAVMKYSSVFNAEQCHNFPERKEIAMSEEERANQNVKIETIIANSFAPVLFDGGSRAYYSPGTDSIHLPKLEAFDSMQDYYATALHEIAHSTGHQSRLDRDMGGGFGSESYAKEELRAELACVFMQMENGIQLNGKHISNHAAYLNSWLEAAKKDTSVFYKAAADAQRIADYVEQHYTQAVQASVAADDSTVQNNSMSDFQQANENKREIEQETLNRSRLEANIKEWYLSAYPTDELGGALPDTVTFKDLRETIYNGGNYYETVNVADSIVRERLFRRLAEISNTTYAEIYYQWMGEETPSQKLANVRAEARQLAQETGEPYVTIEWSEHQNLNSYDVLPLSKADKLLASLDAQEDKKEGYYKTKLHIDYIFEGKPVSYENCRFDIGIEGGGLVHHIDEFLKNDTFLDAAERTEAETALEYFKQHIEISEYLASSKNLDYLSEEDHLLVNEYGDQTRRVLNTASPFSDYSKHIPSKPKFAEPWYIQSMKLAEQKLDSAREQARRLAVETGEPYVTIGFTELPKHLQALHSGAIMPLSKADKILAGLDLKFRSEPGYYKTDIFIDFVMEGKPKFYEAEYCIGEENGGLVNHVNNFFMANDSFLSPQERDDGKEILEYFKRHIEVSEYLASPEKLAELSEEQQKVINEYVECARNVLTTTSPFSDYRQKMPPTPEDIEDAISGYSMEKPNLSLRDLIDEVHEMSAESIRKYAADYRAYLNSSSEFMNDENERLTDYSAKDVIDAWRKNAQVEENTKENITLEEARNAMLDAQVKDTYHYSVRIEDMPYTDPVDGYESDVPMQNVYVINNNGTIHLQSTHMLGAYISEGSLPYGRTRLYERVDYEELENIAKKMREPIETYKAVLRAEKEQAEERRRSDAYYEQRAMDVLEEHYAAGDGVFVRELENPKYLNGTLYSNETRNGYKVVNIAKDANNRNIAIIKRQNDYVVAANYDTDDGTWGQGFYDFEDLNSAEKFRTENYDIVRTSPEHIDIDVNTNSNSTENAEENKKSAHVVKLKLMPEEAEVFQDFLNTFQDDVSTEKQIYDVGFNRPQSVDFWYGLSLLGDVKQNNLGYSVKFDRTKILDKIEFANLDFSETGKGEEEQVVISEIQSDKIDKRLREYADALRRNDLEVGNNAQTDEYYLNQAREQIAAYERSDEYQQALREDFPKDFIDDSPQDMAEITQKPQKRDEERKREVEERKNNSIADELSGKSVWLKINVLESSVGGKYGNNTLVRLPDGEYSNFGVFIPNKFIKSENGKIQLSVGSKFTYRLTNDGREVNLTGQELTDCFAGKTIGKAIVRVAPSRKNAQILANLEKNIPSELKEIPTWCCYRTKWNDEKGKKDKFIISPIDGKWASSKELNRFTTFDAALKYARENNCEGLSLLLDRQYGITCIDLDKCVLNAQTGEMKARATKLIKDLEGTYMERSTSGNGVHIFLKDDILKNGTYNSTSMVKDDDPRGDLEVFDEKHIISMTGDMFSSNNNLTRAGSAATVYLRQELGERRRQALGTNKPHPSGSANLSDRELITWIQKSKQGSKFNDLYSGRGISGDKSSDDGKLAHMLLYFNGGDKEQAFRIMRESGLNRTDKPDSYYRHTIDKMNEKILEYAKRPGQGSKQQKVAGNNKSGSQA